MSINNNNNNSFDNNNNLLRLHVNVDYDQDLQKIEEYLGKINCNVVSSNDEITIDLNELSKFDEELSKRVVKNTKRFQELFYKALCKLNPTTNGSSREPIDVLIQQRIQLNETFPDELIKRFKVNFKLLSDEKPVSIRHLKADKVGQLVKCKAMVTRASSVEPLIKCATYTCQVCGVEVFQQLSDHTLEYQPLSECPSDQCKRQNVKGELQLQTRGSLFDKWQQIKLQELSEQVPIGSIPKSINCILTGQLCRQLMPGQVATITGVLLPRLYKGFRQLKAGLMTELFLDVQHLHVDNQTSAEDLIDSESSVQQLTLEGNVYERLAKSIAPEIYGMLDVKKALLLLMVGGCTRNVSDGLSIRGNLNICLMGDPGVAKSQLLKWISRNSPRAIYTTGKGSSGVGLTAAVVKHPLTNELTLEGGALVLADEGICCLDEFDKMDDQDRTAIHEVMEQQTISICKAGLNCQLNARTSILAAANPIHSKFNPRLSLAENVNLPPALLSRFDLLFLLIDQQQSEIDLLLAQHVLSIHKNNSNANATTTFDQQNHIPPNIIKCYIQCAKNQPDPQLTNPQLIDFIVDLYVQKRKDQQKNSAFVQPRSLLSILRLSQALARLRFSSTIVQQDIEEAIRLFDLSRDTLLQQQKSSNKLSTNDLYLREIRKLSQELKQSNLPIDLIRNRLRLIAAFDEHQLMQCIEYFEELDIWTRVGDSLVFI